MGHRYLAPHDFAESILEEEGISRQIAEVRIVKIEGLPRLALFFDDDDRVLLLDREIAGWLTEMLGPHPLVDKFFGMH